MKYYEEPGPKKQGYNDRFRSPCLFSPRAASQMLEILYLVEFLYKGLRMTSSANTNVSIRPVHFLTCCSSFSSLFEHEPDICMIVHIVFQVLVLQKV